ncbi:MAG TPA: organomercurial lyase [Thermoanaerobaculia bacterium]|nr:organomercurial lyase [Thermoanaerobaculia bacterium]
MSDLEIRARIYDALLRTGRAPSAAELGDRQALQRLAAGRVLVLDDAGEILMAPPFSAVPTPFLVHTPSIRAFGNCIWDALGIAAMAKSDAHIETSCGDCGALMRVDVEGDTVKGGGIMHFAIPARMWWQDIVFT